MEFNSHGIWGQGNQLENGIAANGMSGKENLTKIEFINQNVYHVRSTYVEVDGYPYLLELVDQITEETLLGGHGRDEVIKYITVHDFRLYVDILTGIYNRRYYEEQLRDMSHVSAAAMIDMDHFNAINDTYGHPVGDRILITLAQALQKTFSKDIVSRIGGDEFLVYCPRHLDNCMLEHILAQFREHWEDEQRQFPFTQHITLSIGVTYFPEHGSTYQELFQKVDTSMYNSKKGMHSYRIYADEE